MSTESSFPTSPILLPSQDALHNLCLADPLWVERYQGWTELGHGGSATVVRTFGKALGEDLALKVFPRLSADDWTRFRQEVRNAQRLTSPYIVRTYSPFPRKTFAWIELELIEGTNLKQALETGAREGRPFSFPDALEIAIALTTALVAAHAAEIVHRDVKPANVLLPRGACPVAKLGDFGISRLSGAARLTSTGLLVGTPQFAAPEVIGGSLGGPASDIYSLSLCVYLLLSNNRFPFRVSDESPPAQWLRAHTDQAPAAVTAFREDTPPELVELLERGLAKDPRERPTAEEFLGTLASFRGAGETRAPNARAPHARSGLSRVARASIVLATLALAAVGGRMAWERGWTGAALPSSEADRSGADGFPDEPLAITLPPATEPPLTATSDGRPDASSASPARLVPSGLPAAADRTAARPGPFRAALDADVLTVRNTSDDAFTLVRVVVVAADRRRHTAVVSDGLGPREAVFLALEGFLPKPSSGERLERVEIAADGASGPRPPVVLPLR